MTKGVLRYSKNAWHYKFMLWVWAWSDYNPEWKNGQYAHRIPRSLCPYMRKLVFGIGLAPFLYIWRKMPDIIQDSKDLAIITVVISFVVHGIVHLVNLSIAIAGGQPMPWYVGWVVIFGGAIVIITFLLVTIGIIKVFSKTFEYIRCKRGTPETEIRKPSTMCLVEDFLEAKHDKICPMIEFVDDEKK